MDEHKLPSNIRQIGSISNGLKIYIEDFVYTYLNQYAEAGDYCEKIAFLVGNKLVIDGESVLFVCGAIQGKNLTTEDGAELFSDKSFYYAEEQIAKYFKGLEIVGWMQSQPGYSTRLNPVYEQYHRNNFKDNYQVLFVLDPIERMNAFYRWDKAEEKLEEINGYFIYYDKNNGMQEYMLQNRLAKYKINDDEEAEAITKARKKSVPTTYTAKNPSIARTAAKRMDYSPRGDKRLSNMLVTLSAVLFVICFIMGAGLIQNENRITTLEDDLSDLLLSYGNIQAQLKLANTQSVFAGQQTSMPTESPKPTQTSTYPPISVVTAMPTESIAPATATPTETPTEVPTETPETDAPETETPETNAPETNAPDGDTLFQTYVIQAGDSLSFISEKFYGSTTFVDQIMQANDMTDPDKIMIGQELRIPILDTENQ